MTADVIPFPKPAKRVRLRQHKWKKLRDEVCAGGKCFGCDGGFHPGALDAHHVYPRSLGGDDVFENLVPLCGSGTTGCHGAYESRGPGWLVVAMRVRRRVERDHVALLYLVKKLGTVDAARSFLDRYYPEHHEGGPDRAA